MAGHADSSADDVVEYRLYPEIPEGYDEKECEKYLEDVRDTCLAHLSQYIVDYIWQSEPFRLRAIPTSTGFGPPHLYGKTHYGDNVEDEWFIVYLLQQLTQRFTGCVAKVGDADGEFLLIEAANNLPKWLNPTTAENRVYIYGGRINIIPLPEHPGQITPLPAGIPQINHGVRCIREYPHMTTAPDAIQRDVQYRMAGFPEKLRQSQHRAHCYIPAPLAAVLDRDPALVAPMVQAFYHRDPLDLKACVIMKHFRPGTRVMREVKFTRILYAQLMQQRFNPDKRGGWNVPAPNNPKFKAFDLGMKLAHGAEILCSQCGNFSPSNKSRVGEFDTRWQRFKSKLSEKGYFKGEIEGSKLYTKLEEDARLYFQSSVITDSFSGPESGRRILTVLANAIYDIEDMRREEKDLPSPDDDSWLEMSPEQLDDMLNKAASHDPMVDSFNLSNMADSMKAFVEKVSSHEGAEFPKGSEEGDIQFDPGSFIQTMQKMFEFEDSASDSSTDMSEYGSDDELDSTQSPRKVPVKPVPPPRPKKDTKPQKSSGSQRPPTNEEETEDYLGMQDYIHQMDKELAKTTIGQSFEKGKSEKKPRPSRPPPPRPGVPPRRPTTAPPPPPRKTAPRATLDDDLDIDEEEDEDFEPVDIDLNMVKNLLESYSSQEGLAGPTSNILGSMGLKIPKNEDE